MKYKDDTKHHNGSEEPVEIKPISFRAATGIQAVNAPGRF